MRLSPYCHRFAGVALVAAGCGDSAPEAVDAGDVLPTLAIAAVEPDDLFEGEGGLFRVPVVVHGRGFTSATVLDVVGLPIGDSDEVLEPKFGRPVVSADGTMLAFELYVKPRPLGSEATGTGLLSIKVSTTTEEETTTLPVTLLPSLEVTCTNESCPLVVTTLEPLYASVRIAAPAGPPSTTPLHFDVGGPVAIRATGAISIGRRLNLAGVGPVPGPGGCVGGNGGAAANGEHGGNCPNPDLMFALNTGGAGGVYGPGGSGGGGGGGLLDGGQDGNPVLAGFGEGGLGVGPLLLEPASGSGGGGGGGHGSDASLQGGDGGGGGGMLEISSLSEILITATINIAGADGARGDYVEPGPFCPQTSATCGACAPDQCCSNFGCVPRNCSETHCCAAFECQDECTKAIHAGGGGGGSGGVLLVRAASFVHFFFGVNRLGGKGGFNGAGTCAYGGAGSIGAFRVDAGDIVGAFGSALPATSFQGGHFVPGTFTPILTEPFVRMTIRGQSAVAYAIRVDGLSVGQVTVLPDGLALFDVPLEVGYHRVCVGLTTVEQPDPTTENCIRIARIPPPLF